MANSEREAVRLVSFIEGGRNPETEQELIALINRTKRADRSQAWRDKMSLQQRLICEAAAGDALRALGYPTESDGAVTISPLAVGYYRGSDVVFRAKNRILRAMKPAVIVGGSPAARAHRGA
jgi:hypothetical protein